jgi:pimeloyl-ACP methyl ester carboxylesterase
MKIDSSGIALDVNVEGEGRPVVLVHGFPDTKRLWSKQVPALVDAGFQVITYDQRGYGASDKPAELDAYSIPFLAIDLTTILDHLGIEQAHLVGHDWGAAVVWATAALAPARVDHLVPMSVGHPSAFANMSMSQREKSWYMLLFQFAPEAEQWLTIDDGANFREWCHHPDFDAVFAEYTGNG